MGNDQPQSNLCEQSQKSQGTTPEEKVDYIGEEQFFLVQQINRIKLQSGINDILFYWIDPRIYNDQNGKNLKAFKEKLTIQQFSSVGSLQNQLSSLDTNNVVLVICAASLPDQNYKYMNQQKRITQVVLFCQNQERANLLMSNFPKITSVGFTSAQVLTKIKAISQKHPAKEMLRNSVLFMSQEDIATLNKYRINYYCLTNQKTKKQAKKQFQDLAKRLYPDQLSQIQDFAKNYSLELEDEQRRKQTLQWAFRDSFYWNLVQNLPKITTDPRRLAYLRLPVKDIYQAIFDGYKQIKKKPTDLFIVLQLNQDQKRKIAENHENFLIFTTFIKGYTDQKEALQQFKRRGSKAFKFDIIVAKKLHQQLDFGFLQSLDKISQNVIFNIYNFFKITDISVKARRGTLQYGSLAQAFKTRLDPNARSKLKNQQKNLLRNYDYLQDLMKKIKNQGNVLQLSGYYKESIQLYDRKLEEITRTNKPAAMLDEYRMQKGDALKMSQQYDLAQKEYFSVVTQKLKLVAKIKLVQLYFMRQDTQKVEQMLSDLEKEVDNLKIWGFTEEYFRAKNYIGLNLMKHQKFKQANKNFKNLRNEMSEYYEYKIEGIPLVHQIYRNLALSQTKINNHEQALNLLNSTKSWQQSSEGRGPTLILTERMIQNVYHSKGDKEGMQESRQAAEKMIIEQSAINISFIDASRGAVKVQQNIQQSFVGIDLDLTTPNKKNNNIDQSLVVVDI